MSSPTKLLWLKPRSRLQLGEAVEGLLLDGLPLAVLHNICHRIAAIVDEASGSCCSCAIKGDAIPATQLQSIQAA